MSNPIIPREDCTRWMDEIAANRVGNKLVIANVVRKQRGLGRWIKANSGTMGAKLGVRAAYTMGVVGRLFELAGGSMTKSTSAQLVDAQERVGEVAAALFPADDGFAERLRDVPWRAQPHLLDELLAGLFDDLDEDGPAPEILAQMFLLVWVAVEVLDAAWTPDPAYEGAGSYVYVEPE